MMGNDEITQFRRKSFNEKKQFLIDYYEAISNKSSSEEKRIIFGKMIGRITACIDDDELIQIFSKVIDAVSISAQKQKDMIEKKSQLLREDSLNLLGYGNLQ